MRFPVIRSTFAGCAALVIALAGGPLPAAPTAPSRTPVPRPALPRIGRPQRPMDLPRGRMPDSVLAWVGDRKVTVGRFRSAWAELQPPARPDSLTPQSAREFLDLLVDKEVLGLHALREALPWSERESLSFAGFRDQTVLRARLDTLLADEARRQALPPDARRDPLALGIAVRETTMARIHARYDELLASRLAMRWAALPRPNPDSSLFAQLRMMGEMPRIEPADTGKSVAWSDQGPVRVSELLESWRRTDPYARPRVEKAEQVRDLAKNVLFERWLRSTAREQGLERRPDLAARIESRREFQAVNRLVARDVDGRMAPDEAALRRWYDAHLEDYRLPDIVELIQLVLPSRGSAGTMFELLRDPAKAETLAAQGRRGGANYRAEVTLESDSATFRAAMRLGAGAVLGPDSTARGWRVARVAAIRPSRLRSFPEARALVEHHYRNTEAERLMQDLLVRLRKQTPIRLNDRALAQVARR